MQARQTACAVMCCTPHGSCLITSSHNPVSLAHSEMMTAAPLPLLSASSKLLLTPSAASSSSSGVNTDRYSCTHVVGSYSGSNHSGSSYSSRDWLRQTGARAPPHLSITAAKSFRHTLPSSAPHPQPSTPPPTHKKNPAALLHPLPSLPPPPPPPPHTHTTPLPPPPLQHRTWGLAMVVGTCVGRGYKIS